MFHNHQNLMRFEHVAKFIPFCQCVPCGWLYATALLSYPMVVGYMQQGSFIAVDWTFQFRTLPQLPQSEDFWECREIYAQVPVYSTLATGMGVHGELKQVQARDGIVWQKDAGRISQNGGPWGFHIFTRSVPCTQNKVRKMVDENVWVGGKLA